MSTSHQLSVTSQREIKLTNLPQNVRNYILKMLSPRNQRMLAIALRDPHAARVLQHAWKQFKQGQIIGIRPKLPNIHRGSTPYVNYRQIAPKLGIINSNVPHWNVTRVTNAWKALAKLPREQRRLIGLGNVHRWRGPIPPAPVHVKYSTNGRSIPGVSQLIKNLHNKSNEEFKNYVTKRYSTYKKAANDLGQIDRFTKRFYRNFENKPTIKLLYPKLKKNWWNLTKTTNNA